MPLNLDEKKVMLIPHDCLVKLQAIYGSLKSAEKKAADLLLNDPAFMANATIVEAAHKAGCSEATLVRLARKLGYEGYPELKNHLKAEGTDKKFELYENINVNDSSDMVLKKVFQASIQALQDTLNVLDKEEHKRAVDAILNAGKLVFCGVGDAANVAMSGYQKFIRIGANVHASADPDIQLITASHLARGDVLVAISHSGRTRSILDVVKYAKAMGVTVISITNYPMAPLAKNSDIVLLTAAFTEHLQGEIMSKRVTELCIIESLFVNALIKKQDIYLDSLKKSNIALEINKM